MKLHLVSGFLGSGKTTAIIMAAQTLMARGMTVGVVTNDQGKYLVDAAFARSQNIPMVDLMGGCFCCRTDEFVRRVDQLIADYQPDLIFAESIGSCADMVATVVKPLLMLRDAAKTPASLSTFVDCRLLARRLSGEPMPFSDEVTYIFDQQIAESDLIVINKIDLIGADDIESLWQQAQISYPTKQFTGHSALTPAGVMGWLERLQSDTIALPGKSADLDRDRYAAGQAKLAWMDLDLRFSGMSGGYAAPGKLFGRLERNLREHGAAIGHLKAAITGGEMVVKVSATACDRPEMDSVTWPEAEEVTMLINLRAEVEVDWLRTLIRREIAAVEAAAGCQIRIVHADGFYPPPPEPSYRIM